MLEKRNEITQQINAQLQSRDGSANLSYIEMGPSNVGGRSRAVFAYEENTNIMFASSVSGGVWKSTDAGGSWTKLPDFDDNLVVGSMDRLGNGWIVVGTGSTFERPNGNEGSGFFGNGLFITKDEGLTFELVSDDSDTPVDFDNGWGVFNRIKADPLNDNMAWAATSKGLRRINFTSGELELPSGASGNVCYDVAVSSDGATILTAYANAIALSVDSGNTFTFINGSGPGQLKFPQGRTTLAISPDDDNYMYALMATSNERLDGLFYTTDKGATWTQANWPAGDENDLFVSLGGQGFYDNVITVIPGEPGVAVMGGVTLWKAGPMQQPIQIALNFASVFSPFYVHSDIHSLTWADNNTLLIGCDGGIHEGNYDGSFFTFSLRNNGFNVTQFYEIAIDNELDNIMGGTQDNGTQFVDGEGFDPQSAVRVIGGDGFACDLSHLLPGAGIGSVYNGDFRRARDITTGNFSNFVGDIGTNFGGFNTLGRLFEYPNEPLARGHVYTFKNETNQPLPKGTTVTFDSKVATGLALEYELEEDLAPNGTVDYNDPTSVLYAVDEGTSIYVTREALNFETQPDFWLVADNVFSNQLEFDFLGNHLFSAGFGVTRISGLRNVWEESDVTGNVTVTRTTVGGGGVLTDVAVNKLDPNIVVAVKPGYNVGNHVFLSTNALSSNPVYTSIDGDLPDIPVYAVDFAYEDPTTIFLGTEEGLYVTTDGGQTWVNQAVNGFDRVPIFDIRTQRRSWRDSVANPGATYIGTHGRGFFRTEDFMPPEPPPNNISEINKVNNVQLAVFPNPVVNDIATLRLETKGEFKADVLNIMNLNGQVVQSIDARNLQPRANEFKFNVSELPAGIYMANVTLEKGTYSTKFIKK